MSRRQFTQLNVWRIIIAQAARHSATSRRIARAGFGICAFLVPAWRFGRFIIMMNHLRHSVNINKSGDSYYTGLCHTLQRAVLPI